MRKSARAARSLLGGVVLLMPILLSTVSAQQWTGTIDDDWFNPGNWSTGQVPPIGCSPTNLCTQVVINVPGNVAITDGDANLGASLQPALIVGQNGPSTLTVGSGGTLTALESQFFVANAFIGQNNLSNGILNIVDGGEVSLNNLTLANSAGAIGTLNIGNGGAAGFLNAAAVNGGGGNATLNFNHTDADYTFTAPITGSVKVNQIGSGSTRLEGNNTYTGATNIQAGTLVVGGNLTNSAVSVQSGASLVGEGTTMIGGVVTVASGGSLLVSGDGVPGMMTVGALTLSAGSTMNFELGQGGGDPGQFGDLLVVNNSLVLDGELVITDIGGFEAGTYALIDFSNVDVVDFTDNLLVLTSLPDGFDGNVVVDIDSGFVNLIITSTQLGAELYWDGGNTVANGEIDGGDGTWNNSSANWTDDGSVNGSWTEQIAIFAGEAGTVSVEDDVRFTRLIFETDGYLIAGDGGSLVSNLDELDGLPPRVVIDDAGVTATIDALINPGTDAGLRKDGDGTLVLTGDNTYTGVTDIRAGRLELGDGGATGGISGNVTMLSGSVLALNRVDDVEVGQIISGGGRVEQMGAGTTVFTADQAYVGATWVLDGMLQLGNGGSAGWVSSDQVLVQGDGTLAFNRSDARNFSAVLTGNGDLVQRGSGEIVLSGNSGSFAGSTYVESGRLRLTGTLGGHAWVLENGAFDAVGTLGGDLSVDGGSVSMIGAVIGGDLFGNAGVIHVTDSEIGGDVQLGGADAHFIDAVVGGEVKIQSGSRLTGTGTFGGLIVGNGGILAPGGSIGTLSIGGNLEFAAGAQLEIEAAPDGQSDLLQVAGSATLNGGNVLVIEAGGEGAPWQVATEYTILTAGGGVTGQFDDVSNNFAFLDPSLRYGSHSITLVLERNDVQFGSLPGLTVNQAAAGTGVESVAAANIEHPLVSAVMMVDEDGGAQNAFSLLSGEFHASLRSMLLDDGALIRDAVMSRGVASGDKPGIWMRALAHDGRMKGDSHATLKRRTGGLLLGKDFAPADNVTLGWATGYQRSSADADTLMSEGDVDSIHASIYGSAQWKAPLMLGRISGERIGVRVGTAYSWHEVDTHRSVNVGDFSEDMSAEYDAGLLQVFGELDYRTSIGNSVVAPFLGFAWARLNVDGFAEGDHTTDTGSTAVLRSPSGSSDVSFVTLGARGSIPMAGDRFWLDGMLGWRHATKSDVEARHRFGDGASDAYFTTTGVPLARNALVADLGLTLGFESGSLGLSWVGQIASEARDNAVQARFEWLLE